MSPDEDDIEAGAHKQGFSARPIASPLPVGMLALAVGSMLLSGKQFGWLPDEQGQALPTFRRNDDGVSAEAGVRNEL